MPNVTVYGHRITLNEKGQRGYVVTYLVTGVANSTAALVASGVPQAGMPYSLAEPYCIVVGIISGGFGGQVNTTGFLVEVTYEIRPNGGRQQNPTNPLLIPTRWTMDVGTTDEQFDTDKDGKPITTSTRERYNQTYTRSVPLIQMTAKKWFAASNINSLLALPKSYAGTINKDGWKFGLKAMQVKCMGGGPVGEFYETGNSILEMLFRFHIQEDPFLLRLKDEGFKRYNPNYGKATGSYPNVLDKYIDAYPIGQTASSPLALNGKGYAFGEKKSGEGTPSNATLELTSDAAFLKYKIFIEKSFSGLRL